MKKILLTLTFIFTLTNAASAFAIPDTKFVCTNKKNKNDMTTLTIHHAGSWNMVDKNGEYVGYQKMAILTGNYLLFKAPTSTVSRGDSLDDVKIGLNLFKPKTQTGNVLIIWADEDGDYHTDKFLCEQD